MTKIQALVKFSHLGPRILVGFSTAEEISLIATAPAFLSTTAHASIAGALQKNPVEEWQRPADQDRIKSIAETFSNLDEVMPNPVLLCENPFCTSDLISESPTQRGHAVFSESVELDISPPVPGDHFPLWILDGQHRIAGLTNAALANPAAAKRVLPVVLLLNDSVKPWEADALAKIFAQVTTTAKGLSPCHNEWLTYAFSLGRYSALTPKLKPVLQKHAMACVVDLCTTTGNPFYNKVRFNDVPSPGTKLTALFPTGSSGGFAYNCAELQSVIFKHYSSKSTRLEASTDVAEHIISAYSALTSLVSAPKTSVFLGSVQFEHKIMQTAFLSAALRVLTLFGKKTTLEWTDILTRLGFGTTDWNFQGWQKKITLNGSHASTSAKIAEFVLQSEIVAAAKDSSYAKSQIVDILKGNRLQAQVDVVSNAPKMKKSINLSATTNGGNVQSPHWSILKLRKDMNAYGVGKAQVYFGFNRGTQSKAARKIDRPTGQGLPMQIDVLLESYGGSKTIFQFEIVS